MFIKPEVTLMLKKNKKLLFLAIVGVILMFAGNLFTEKEISIDNENLFNSSERINETKLEQILSNIEGAGNVKIFITYENKGVYEYAVDSKRTVNTGSDEEKHVFSNKEPVIKSYTNAQIRGIIATATGADDNIVKNRLIKSIKAATGVGLDKINIETGVK